MIWPVPPATVIEIFLLNGMCHVFWLAYVTKHAHVIWLACAISPNVIPSIVAAVILALLGALSIMIPAQLDAEYVAEPPADITLLLPSLYVNLPPLLAIFSIKLDIKLKSPF